MKKFETEKGAIVILQLLLTTSWKAILNIFISDENIALKASVILGDLYP